MPFKSKSQMRACFAANDPDWNCKEWAKKTKNTKVLPETVKKASVEITHSFSKIAKELFDKRKTPPVPTRVIQQKMIQTSKQDKMKGMSPVEYRNELTSRRTGIVQRNKESAKGPSIR